MAKFKHKNGGICEVYSLDNIEKLSKDKNYTKINENKLEVKENKPNVNLPAQPTENPSTPNKN